MPRAAWFATGMICGALIAAAAGGGVGAAFAASGLICLAGAARATRHAPLGSVSLGAALIVTRAAVGMVLAPPDVQPAAALAGASHVASVVSVGAADGGQQRVVLELAPPEPNDRVYAWLPRYPAVAAFDRLRFGGALDPPPDGDFGDFLARSGIGHTVRIRSFELIGSVDTPLAQLEHVRRAAAELLARAVPQPQAGLAAGLLIGLRDLVPRDVAADFRVAGLSHVVAISGSHLALIAAFVTALLRRLGRRPRSLIVLGLIWAYAVLAGASPSVIRAAVMVTVVIGARESGRAGQARGALAVTAAVMLLVDPMVITDIGFQLSLAATAGLLAWAAPIGAHITRRVPRQTPAFLVEGLAMSLAAQLATQPLVLFHFGQLSIVAPLANLLAAPIVAPAMLSSAVAMAASAAASLGMPDVLVAPAALAAAISVGALIAVAQLCAALPLASLTLEPPLNLVGAALAALAVIIVARPRPAPEPDTARDLIESRRTHAAEKSSGASRRRPVVWAAAAATAALLLSTLVVSAQPDGRLHMTVLDVGQGDSILLEGPRGGRILVDTGPDPDRLLSLLDARLPAWDRRLDVVVITHPHEDHVAGLALLLDRYRIGDIAEPGMIGLGPGDAAFRRRLAELGRQTRLLAAGDRMSIDGIELDVLWPPPGGVPLHPSDGGTGVNNVSIVLALQFGERRFLLTGDVEQQIDPRLLADGLLGSVGAGFDVLKVAHHGSGTATTDAFLERTRPQVAVVSAGWGNPYGHPSARTVGRLEAGGAQVFRTDLDGSVEITTDGRDLVADASGGRLIPTRPAAQLAPPGPGWCPIPQVAYQALAPP